MLIDIYQTSTDPPADTAVSEQKCASQGTINPSTGTGITLGTA